MTGLRRRAARLAGDHRVMRRFVAWCSVLLLVGAFAQAGEKKRTFVGTVDVAGVSGAGVRLSRVSA